MRKRFTLKMALLVSSVCIAINVNAQVIFEAEDAFVSSGIIDTEHTGFTGDGYVDTENLNDVYVEWSFNSLKSVTDSLGFRYALGKDEHRTMQVLVNDVLIDTIDFNNTTLFTNYIYKYTVGTIVQGPNKVKLMAINAQGAPNLDHLTVRNDTNAYFKISTSVSGNGTLSVIPVADSFKYGTRVRYAAEPLAGNIFSGWSGDFPTAKNPFSFTIDKAYTVGATFLNNLPAFPGAEGFAKNTTGGRGGAVIEVTNLDDSGVGSLRAAINTSGKRTIVFRVSGTIDLQSKLSITKGDVTIAGQTAPGDGITLSGYTLTVSANNVIIRYIRSRLGDVKLIEDDAMNGRNYQNILLDHCTMSWSVDELGSFYDNTNFTMQYCLLSESLYMSVHDKGAHGYTGIWGGKGASFHHNLLANSYSRNPRFCGSRYSNLADLELVDFRNNVIFNWGGNSGYAGEGGRYNMVNNYYKYGPATSSGVRDRIFQPYPDDGKNAQAAGIWGMFYVNGNYVNEYPNVTENNWIGIDPNPLTKPQSELKSEVEFEVADVTTQSAKVAFENVLAQVGTCLPKRDVIDNRIIQEVITGKTTYGGNWGAGKGIIDTQESVGGWPELESTTPPVDTDHDGMPDIWETARGLSINDPADRNGDDDVDGYTNLEEYLNSLVENYTYIIRPLNFDAQVVSGGTINLTWVDSVSNETGFVIERSNGGDYAEILTVPANSSSFIDSVPEYNYTYSYRMRAVNATDTSFYTDTAMVSPVGPSGNHNSLLEGNVSVYPNPFTNKLTVSYYTAQSDNVNIVLHNVSGDIIYSYQIDKSENGRNDVQLDISFLSKGIYYLTVQSGNNLAIKKVVKL